MTLAAFKISTRPVSFKGGSFELRGLSLNDISVLMRDYLDDINALFKLYDANAPQGVAMVESAKFAIGFARDSPLLVASMIASCAGEPEAVDVAVRLPFDTTVECLQAIIELTFEEAGGAKKFFDKVMNLVTRIRPAALGEV